MLAPPIEPRSFIPDLLASRLQLRPVLDRYGLRGCGGQFGPAESLEFFAHAHEVPLPDLIGELGFRPLAYPLIRRTLAAHLTVVDACRRIDVPLDDVLAAFNRAAPRYERVPLTLVEAN